MKTASFGALQARVIGEGDGPLLVLLHGFGAPGDDLVGLSRALNGPQQITYVFPEAPIDLGFQYLGGRAWWHIDMVERARRQALGAKRDINEVPDGLAKARDAVNTLLDEAENKFRPTKVVLGGFSQGAMLALDVALRAPSRNLAGLLLMSGTHIAASEWAPLLPARHETPVFMSHGRTDEILPFEIASELRETLVQHKFLVDWVPFAGGHGIGPEVVLAANTFLSRTLS